MTFVQLLYLESLRLRTRDLPALEFFKETLEDRLGLKTEEGAGAFSLIKHTAPGAARHLLLRVVRGRRAVGPAIFWQAALTVWLAMMAVAYALPQLLYRRTDGAWLLPLVPLLRGLAWLAAPVRGAARLLPIADRPGRQPGGPGGRAPRPPRTSKR